MTRGISVRLGLRLGGALLGALLSTACGPTERTVLLHQPVEEGARAIWAVDFIHEFTIPENFRYRTDEYGAAAADPARGLVYVGSRDGSLLAIDDDRGRFVWELDLGGGVSSMPILVVVELERGLGRIAGPQDRADWLIVGTDDGALVVVDLETQAVVWRYRTSGVIRNQAVIGEGLVYFANSRDELFAVDLRSGEWVWAFSGAFQKDFTVFGRAGLAYLPPDAVVSGESLAMGMGSMGSGVLFTGFADGKVVALDAGSGSPKWSQPLAPLEGDGLFVDVDTTPLLYPERGELIVANQSSGLFALSIEDGGRRWNRPIRAVGSLAKAPGGLIMAASSLEGLFGIEQDGRVRWHQQLDPGAIAAPLVVGPTTVVAHSDFGLLAFQTADGQVLARFFNGSGSSGPPVFDPTLGRVYATSNRGQLYALRMLSGR